MAIIPQVITEDRASGAQVVDGSLKFDNDKSQYLTRTPSSAGNRKTWTWSGWVKKSNATEQCAMFSAGSGSNAGYGMLWFQNDGTLYFHNWDGVPNAAQTNALFRDIGWYHVVAVHDENEATAKMKFYVNGTLQSLAYNLTTSTGINDTIEHRIGMEVYNSRKPYDGSMSQVYFIDGQVLGPENFGYTDPLTNVWRPKKFSGYFNQQIEDFSDTLPILNTNSDGSAVTSGTRTDSLNSNWILGLAMNTSANIYTDLSPSAGDATDYSNVTASTTTSRFYGTSAYFNGTDAKLIVNDTRFDFSSTNFTMETWIYVPTTPTESEIVFTSSNPDLFGSGSTAGVLVGWNSSNQLFVYVGSDTTPSITNSSTTAVSINKWHHIAIAKSGSTITLYIDGVASGTTTTAVGNSTSGFYAAHQPANDRWFEAYYQDIRVYTTAKYTSNFNPPVGSVNSFYLPFDGSAPIGQDQSGKGNDWTPVNFGGSNTLEKATGALPILNTDGGGKTARPGVFGSEENKYYTVTTADGSVYQFDITSGDNPSLSFIRGATYKFDYSSFTGHPVLFSSTNPDSSTTAYTDGTDIASNVISFTVPHDAPDTLYYYCQNHPTSMNGSISITTDTKKADPYASNCVLALPLVGANSDVSASIACTMTNKAVTSNGDAAASSAQSNFYGGSYYFDGTGDYITIPAQSDFDIKTNDFTVECWVNMTVSASGGIYNTIMMLGQASTEAHWALQVNTDRTFNFLIGTGGWGFNNTGSSYSSNATIADNTWYHIAVVRSGTNTLYFVNGNLDKTITNNTFTDTTSGGYFWLGSYAGYSSAEMTGYLQDVRIYKGVAKYTSNFIPASTNPDILPDTPSGVSGSSKLTKIIDGSVSFDGTDDYLNVPWSSDFELGTGDFTIEYYGYWNTSGTSIAWGQTIDERFDLGSLSAGSVRFFCRSSASTFINISADIASSKWYHIAAVREGTAFRLYIDGKLGASGTASDTMPNDSSRGVDIGRRRYSTSDSTYTNGLISNLRIIKGTALYTSEFTPPSAPLTSVANTKLLCCQKPTEAMIGFTTATASGALPILNTNDDGTSVTSGNRSDAYSSNLALALPLLNNTNDIHADIKGSGSNKTITTSGNIVASSDSSQLYGGSYIFDGSGYLEVSGTLFGSGPWTFECWLNLDDTGEPFLKVGSNTGATFNISNTSFQTDGDGVARLLYTGQNFGIYANTWFHFALVNDGTNPPIPYVNGIAAIGSADRGTAANTAPAGTLRLGDSRPAGGVLTPYNGYMQDVRLYDVVKYTSNFTPIGTFLRPQAAVSPSAINVNGNVSANNFNPFTTDINAVRGQETGYCTWNPLVIATNNSLSDGNLTASHTASTGWTGGVWNANSAAIVANTGVSSGSWYWEVHIDSESSAGNTAVGITTRPVGGPYYVGYQDNGISYTTTQIYQDSSYGSDIGSLPTTAAGDIIGVALDMDNGHIWFSKNGVYVYGNPYTRTESQSSNIIGTMYPAVTQLSAAGGYTVTANFGQKPFKFPPPDGFQPLNAANVRPSTVIARPDHYVGVTTYSGDTSSSAIDVTGFNFKPDLVWVKKRTGSTDVTARSHVITDSVRGAGVHLRTDDNDDEASLASDLVTGFNIDGFTAGYHQASNYTGSTYVAWGWKAGTPYTPTVTGGFSAPSASINTDAGFGIYKVTGSNSQSSFTTGLNEQADFIICKNLDNAYDWGVYHRSHAGDAPSTKLLHLNNNTNPSNKASTLWYQTGTTIEVNSYAETGSNGDYIYYVWHDVPGLQKFGSYTGNVDTNGAYIELGFRPAIIMTKASNTTSAWGIWDSERNKSNPVSENLYPNLSNDKDAAYPIDFLSNGFKIRNIAEFNNSTSGVIYAAWAEAPSFNLYGGQSNAR